MRRDNRPRQAHNNALCEWFERLAWDELVAGCGWPRHMSAGTALLGFSGNEVFFLAPVVELFGTLSGRAVWHFGYPIGSIGILIWSSQRGVGGMA